MSPERVVSEIDADEMTLAWQEGNNARKKFGSGEFKCPYNRNTADGRLWIKGFRSHRERQAEAVKPAESGIALLFLGLAHFVFPEITVWPTITHSHLPIFEVLFGKVGSIVAFLFIVFGVRLVIRGIRMSSQAKRYEPAQQRNKRNEKR